jgi:hypothetical protein
MQNRDIAGFFLMPLVLIVVAWVINTLRLWDSLANLTLPWLCTAVAIAVLILGVVCVVLQAPPSAIPSKVAIVVVAGFLAIFGIGLIVDMYSYPHSADWLDAVAGWVGFAVILSGVFALPHMHVKTDA